MTERIEAAFEEWSWERQGIPVGSLAPIIAAKLGFEAGVAWAKGTVKSADPLPFQLTFEELREGLARVFVDHGAKTLNVAKAGVLANVPIMHRHASFRGCPIDPLTLVAQLLNNPGRSRSVGAWTFQGNSSIALNGRRVLTMNSKLGLSTRCALRSHIVKFLAASAE
jgi:hypothetical protein